MLQRRHVLILVHGEPANGFTDTGGLLVEFLQHMAHHEQDVVEIHFATSGLFKLVRVVDVSETRRLDASRCAPFDRDRHALHLARRNQGDLRPVDFVTYRTNRDVIHIVGKADPAHGTSGDVTRILDEMRERRLAHVGPDATQLPQCGGVECGRRDLIAHAQGFESYTHFGGGFDGEGHREHARRLPLPAHAGVGDAPGHGPGLARARASYDAHRSAQRRRRGQLRIIQPFKQLVVHVPHCGKRYAHASTIGQKSAQ